MSDEVLDVAVIGGGVSGVYTAWRLLTHGAHKTVTVFEASDHIGGRLLSIVPPKIPHMVAELGGMRILPAVQPRIFQLINVLNHGASENDQIELYDFPVTKPNNIAYLRGTHLRISDFTDEPDKVPYKLAWLERGHASSTILVNAIEQIVPGITNKDLTESQRRDMTRHAEFDGKPLYQLGFWNVLMRVISAEAYQLGVDAGGYETIMSNWNAADAIPWYLSDFGVEPKYKGFVKGFQQVPLTIAERFQSAGGQIEFGAAADAFNWDGQKKVAEINFKDGRTVRARSLILAMPRRSLDLLSPGSPLLAAKANLVKTVTPRPLFKIFTTFESPWWTVAGVNAGQSVTDLPVRQTYYWPKNDGKPATEGRAMLMASYDDGTNIGFWDGLRPRRGQGWREGVVASQEAEMFEGEADHEGPETSEWRKYRATKDMVREVERELGLVHDLPYVPKVVTAAFKDWGDDPFGGGWNSWNIGVKSWEVKKEIIKPYDEIPLYICGEAYSNAQGWVEGALQTADMVLEKFHLSPME